jgi:hypothetical protein
MDDNNPMDGLGGLHPGGVFVTGYCDGSVKMVNAGIDVNAFKWLLTVAGGEVVNQ